MNVGVTPGPAAFSLLIDGGSRVINSVAWNADGTLGITHVAPPATVNAQLSYISTTPSFRDIEGNVVQAPQIVSGIV